MKKKSRLKQNGVSIEESLMNKFDHLIEQNEYDNHSEALRDLQHTWNKIEQIVAASIYYFMTIINST